MTSSSRSAATDEIAGEGGDDRLDGGAGLDYVVYQDSPAGVNVDLTANTATGWGTDTLANIEAIVGSRSNDALKGSAGANYLAGLEGNDSLAAEGGNDYLDGGSGNDILLGGKGYDTVDFFFSPRAVRVSLAVGRASGYGRDRMSNLEDADGSRFADIIVGNASPNWLRGFGGNDRILGVVGRDRLEGGRGRDTVFGGRGGDRLAGGPDRDFLSGGTGRDRVSGGGGRDRCVRGEKYVGCP
jgi:Ca2+-binding RTX toxin-like protein